MPILRAHLRSWLDDPAPSLDRMRHPFATPIRLVRHDARCVVLAALPNWSLVVLAMAFFAAAYAIGGWALLNGAMAVRPVDSFLIGIIVLVLLHVAVRYLLGPLGGDQTFAFDKGAGVLTVTTRGFWKDQIDRYRLRDVVKLHVNRVDDGIYDPGTMLVIFKGGGTLQFPPQRGVPHRVEAAVEVLARFLDVPRSDLAPEAATPRPPAPMPIDQLDLDELALEAWLAQHPPSGTLS